MIIVQIANYVVNPDDTLLLREMGAFQFVYHSCDCDDIVQGGPTK